AESEHRQTVRIPSTAAIGQSERALSVWQAGLDPSGEAGSMPEGPRNHSANRTHQLSAPPSLAVVPFRQSDAWSRQTVSLYGPVGRRRLAKLERGQSSVIVMLIVLARVQLVCSREEKVGKCMKESRILAVYKVLPGQTDVDEDEDKVDTRIANEALANRAHLRRFWYMQPKSWPW
ncbi:unnamed protein product, partial [Protopolystoma xenopodis]